MDGGILTILACTFLGMLARSVSIRYFLFLRTLLTGSLCSTSGGGILNYFREEEQLQSVVVL